MPLAHTWHAPHVVGPGRHVDPRRVSRLAHMFILQFAVYRYHPSLPAPTIQRSMPVSCTARRGLTGLPTCLLQSLSPHRPLMPTLSALWMPLMQPPLASNGREWHVRRYRGSTCRRRSPPACTMCAPSAASLPFRKRCVPTIVSVATGSWKMFHRRYFSQAFDPARIGLPQLRHPGAHAGAYDALCTSARCITLSRVDVHLAFSRPMLNIIGEEQFHCFDAFTGSGSDPPYSEEYSQI